eukprot:TRINITY_DN114_c0_g1_i6.p1 TRINITY_DN114_c0_g1~~TRINITY_DN114_c0_g1_i6.p1  ORF type:complete len:839 (+),score=37.75 TRINITY_DN114_c0_g1_i6:48-2564(+)
MIPQLSKQYPMRAVIVLFALCLGLVLANATADSLKTLNAVTLFDDGIVIINGAIQDDDYFYWFTLNPVNIGKVNKTQMATPGWTNVPLPTLVSTWDTVAIALLDESSESIFMQGRSTIYRISTTNLTVLETLPGEEINSVTGFISYFGGVSVVNLFGYGPQTHKMAQIRVVDPLEISIFDNPLEDVQTSAYSRINDVAIVATFDSQYTVYHWNTRDLIQTFRISSELSSLAVAYDEVNNILYVCGDYYHGSHYFPVLLRLQLSQIQNGSTISIPLTENDPYYFSGAVGAQKIGGFDITCKALVLDLPTNQLLYALYDPPSSSGLIGRAVTSTLDIIETTSVDAAGSVKPIKLLFDDKTRLAYVMTETDGVVIQVPSTFECPLDCSGRGYCNATTNYVCVCDYPSSGHNCEDPKPVPPVEPPLYEPIRLLGKITINTTIGFVADEDFLYFYSNCSVSMKKVPKSEIIASASHPQVLDDLQIGSFGITSALVDPQLDLIYLIGGTCGEFVSSSPIYVRVSMNNFADQTTMALSTPIRTAFTSTNGATTYLNLFGETASFQLKSSMTDNPLQSGPTSIPSLWIPMASVFLPRANEGVVISRQYTAHFSLSSGNMTKRYYFPDNFVATNIAADEEHGKLYVCGYTSGEYQWMSAGYLLVLTPALIPTDSIINVTGNTEYSKSIEFYSPCTVHLNIAEGQAIISLVNFIYRMNLLTNEMFDELPIYDIVGGYAFQFHYDTDRGILFVTARNQATALYIPPPCPRNCSGNGQCVFAECKCDDGFTGDRCDEVAVPVAIPVEAPVDSEPTFEEPVEEPFALPIADITSSAASLSFSILVLFAVTF